MTSRRPGTLLSLWVTKLSETYSPYHQGTYTQKKDLGEQSSKETRTLSWNQGTSSLSGNTTSLSNTRILNFRNIEACGLKELCFPENLLCSPQLQKRRKHSSQDVLNSSMFVYYCHNRPRARSASVHSSKFRKCVVSILGDGMWVRHIDVQGLTSPLFSHH